MIKTSRSKTLSYHLSFQKHKAQNEKNLNVLFYNLLRFLANADCWVFEALDDPLGAYLGPFLADLDPKRGPK